VKFLVWVLEKKCPPGEKKDQISALDDHLTAQDMQKRLGNDLWRELFTFSFIRNPWDRFLSLYFYRRNCGELQSNVTFKDYARQLSETCKENGCITDACSAIQYNISRLGGNDYIIAMEHVLSKPVP
jgi:hypothetical protein